MSGQLAPGERAKLWGVEFRGPRLAESPKLGPGKWRSSGATKGECTSFLRLQLLASGLVLKVPDADGRSRGDPFPAIPALTHRQLDLVRKGAGGASANPRTRPCLLFGKPEWEDLESCLGIHSFSLGLVNRAGHAPQ